MHAHLLPEQWIDTVHFFLGKKKQYAKSHIAGIDGFAGSKLMANSFLKVSLPLIPFEVMDDPVAENCLSLEGQQYFVQTLVRASLKPYGICWLGPPCSWWVWVSRSVHQQSIDNPLGNVTHPKVEFHNALADFVANVIWTCAALGVYFVLEQPVGSLFVQHPRVKAALRDVHSVRIKIHLYKFGATSQKPLQLWGTAPWLIDLEQIANHINAPVPRGVLYTIGHNGQVTGKKEAMAKSTAYPEAFCDVVAFLHQSFLSIKANEAKATKQIVHMFVLQSRPQLQHLWFEDSLIELLVLTR